MFPGTGSVEQKRPHRTEIIPATQSKTNDSPGCGNDVARL